LIISPSGELDHVTSPRLARALRLATMRGHRQIVLDLRDVTFADCSFVHVVVAAYERLYRRGGYLRIVHAKGAAELVLRHSGLPAPSAVVVRPRVPSHVVSGARPARQCDN
jgi:anti-sigma B factor antagonist